MSEFLIEWLGVVLIVLFAAASPGPDFVISIRNSVLHSRRSGVFTAIGIGLGICVHITYCALGIAAIIAQSAYFFTIMKYIGAAYLIFIGIKALRSKGYQSGPIIGEDGRDNRTDLSAFKSLRSGFLTNLLNPKATLFFFALFTQIIDPDTALGLQFLYGISAALTATAWFTAVSFILNARQIRHRFLKFSIWIDRICGGLLITLGVRLAISKI